MLVGDGWCWMVSAEFPARDRPAFGGRRTAHEADWRFCGTGVGGTVRSSRYLLANRRSSMLRSVSAANRPIDWARLLPPEPTTEADYASLRVLGRTTVGKSFPLRFGSTADLGSPTRTVWQVVGAAESIRAGLPTDEEEIVNLHASPAGRIQVKARVVRDRGRVVEIRIERSTGYVGKDARLDTLVSLDEEAAKRLIDLCFALRGIDPADGDTLKIDEDVLATVLQDPSALSAIYSQDPDRFKAVIEADVSAKDVVAVAARRRIVSRFEQLLTDEAEFESARAGGSAEAVWQRFFEENPWLLGTGLSGRLLTSWDDKKLERLVAGASVADVGKRVDALLVSSGIVSSLVFAEVKLHTDALLESTEYRSGTWVPSRAVAGGVAQALVTADRAREDLGQWLDSRDDDGFSTGERVFSGAVRSYLIVGTLASLARGEQVHPDKVRSFELFRRSTSFPEILTYDEVLARAKWSVELAEDEPVSGH